MPQTHLWNVVAVKVVTNFLCAFCASKNASNNYHSRLSRASKRRQVGKQTAIQRSTFYDFPITAYHFLYLFMTPKLITTKYQTSLCPSKKASLWSFHQFESAQVWRAKISRVRPCLICWPFSSCAKVMLGNTANTCHHGPQHSLEFTMPAWSVWFKPFSTTRGMQAAKLPEWEAQGAEATCSQALPPTELQCMSHRKHRHDDIIQNMHMILIWYKHTK